MVEQRWERCRAGIPRIFVHLPQNTPIKSHLPRDIGHDEIQTEHHLVLGYGNGRKIRPTVVVQRIARQGVHIPSVPGIVGFAEAHRYSVVGGRIVDQKNQHKPIRFRVVRQLGIERIIRPRQLAQNTQRNVALRKQQGVGILVPPPEVTVHADQNVSRIVDCQGIVVGSPAQQVGNDAYGSKNAKGLFTKNHSRRLGHGLLGLVAGPRAADGATGWIPLILETGRRLLFLEETQLDFVQTRLGAKGVRRLQRLHNQRRICRKLVCGSYHVVQGNGMHLLGPHRPHEQQPCDEGARPFFHELHAQTSFPFHHMLNLQDFGPPKPR